jgi:hypothetical protein
MNPIGPVNALYPMPTTLVGATVNGKPNFLTIAHALFDVFYGELETAPMIHQCPVNMELKLHDVLDFTTHDIFIGELIQTYAEDDVLTGGKIDVAKLRPLLFDMASVKYWRLGPAVGKCWNVGKSLKSKISQRYSSYTGEKH